MMEVRRRQGIDRVVRCQARERARGKVPKVSLLATSGKSREG